LIVFVLLLLPLIVFVLLLLPLIVFVLLLLPLIVVFEVYVFVYKRWGSRHRFNTPM
jgi:hypothetical protein